MRTFNKVMLGTAALAVIATTTAACSSSNATPTPVAKLATVTGNSTSVALDKNFLAALTSLKLTPGTSGKASLSGTTISFPITGGHVTLYKKGDVTPYVQGEVDHAGSGLTLTAGKTVVTLENFVIDPGNHSNLKGDVLVNGKSAAKGAKLFDLNGSTLQTPTISNGVATLTGTEVLVSDTAAKLLDSTFKTDAVKGGLLVGVATLKVTGS